jgi:hypothetical protein
LNLGRSALRVSFGRSLIIGKAIRIIGLSRLIAVLLIGCLTLPLPAARADGQADRQNLPGNESERPQGLVKPGRIDENESDVESGKIGKIGKESLLLAANDSNLAGAQLDDIDDQILAKTIEVEQLNVHFRMETGLVSKWRQRRLYLYGETNACLTEASLLEQLPIRYQLSQPVHLPPSAVLLSPDARTRLQRTLTRTRDRKNRGRFAFANEEQMTGNCIGIAGDTYEFALNFMNYLRLRKQGYNPSAYHKRMTVLSTELDQLFEERNRRLANTDRSNTDRSANELALATAEGKLLKDIRDCGLSEYKEFHAATKNFWVLQNMAFALDFCKNASSGTGNLVGIVGNHWRRPRFQGGAGVFAIISGALVFVTPIVGRVTGNVSGVAARRLVSSELVNVDEIHTERFEADRKQLAVLAQAAAGGAASGSSDMPEGVQTNANARSNTRLHARLAVYEQEQQLLTKMESYFKAQRKRARGTLVENIAFASIVAPARVSSGITSVIGGWRYWQDPNVRNGQFAAGTTAYAAGTGINILETGRLAVTSELNNAKASRKHALPRQVLTDRLNRLDEMDKLIKR